MAQATGRPCRQVRAPGRGRHRQGQCRGPVTVRRDPARDPGRGGRGRPEQRRDRGHRDGRRRRSGSDSFCPDRPGRHLGTGCPGTGPGPDPGRCHGPGGQRRARTSRDGRRCDARDRRVRCPRQRRPRCPDDPGGPAPPPRARPLARPDPGHRRRRSDHPRRRPAGGGVDPDRFASTGRGRWAERLLGAGGSSRGAQDRDHTPGRRPNRIPRRRRRSPAADDPDAQGRRRADDPRPGGAARLCPHGGGRERPGACPRDRQARIPDARGDLAKLRSVRGQGGGRCPPPLPGVQRPLDGAGPPREAAHPHGCRRRGRRWPPRPGRARRRPALDQRTQSGDRGRRRARPCRQAPPRGLRREHLHRRQHRLVRLEPDDADHQRPGGRDPDDGGDHQAAGRPRAPPRATSSPSARS